MTRLCVTSPVGRARTKRSDVINSSSILGVVQSSSSRAEDRSEHHTGINWLELPSAVGTDLGRISQRLVCHWITLGLDLNERLSL